MAALQELDVSLLTPQIKSQDAIKLIIAQLFWKWYQANKDDKLTRISLFRGLIKKTVYLRDLEPALELLFGPNNGIS
jgi:hypothetical protein